MRPRLLLATSNENKVFEIKKIIGSCIEVFYFKDFGLSTPEEEGGTLEENAFIKAKYGYDSTGLPSVGEDTGLFVDALNGAPGVYSSRFAGKNASDKENREKLLYILKDERNREAKFITVICFYDGKRTEYFKGILEGYIAEMESGRYGFGYDPIFVPRGLNRTLAEMSPEEKNRISHRYRALKEFLKWFIRDL